MLYTNTHYENNHKIYIIADIFEETLHDYYSHYNGALSQFDITEAELHDKYDIHSGSIFGNLTSRAQKFFTEATIAYKQEELRTKASKALQDYNEARMKDGLQNLLEKEAYNEFYLNVKSNVLKLVAGRREIKVKQLIAELIESINIYNDILLNLSEYVDNLSKQISSMNFHALYELNIDEAIDDIIYRKQKAEVVKKKSEK